MTDYSEQGAVPVEDAAVEDPPTVDEVLARQREEHPEQDRTAMYHAPITERELSTIEAGGEPVDPEGGDVEIEGPNSA